MIARIVSTLRLFPIHSFLITDAQLLRSAGGHSLDDLVCGTMTRALGVLNSNLYQINYGIGAKAV